MQQQMLLAKFENLRIDQTCTGISKEDLHFCQKIQEEFTRAMECLNDNQALFKAVQSERPAEEMPHLGIETFCPQADFVGKKKEVKELFITKIFRYFEHKYFLDASEIKFDSLLEIKELDFQVVVERIVQVFGELVDFGITKLKKDFKEKFAVISAHSPDDVPRLKNNKVTVPNMFWYETSWEGEKELNYQSEGKVMLLKRAISFYETGVNQLINFELDIIGYQKLKFSEPYETGFEKLTGLKFFKNRRVDLIFSSSKNARDFFNLFDLANPDDRYVGKR